jgi:hypothetical protein
MADVTPPPAPAAIPKWEDFLEIFTSPSAVFERRKDDPYVFLPLAVVTVVVGIIMFGTADLMQPIWDAEFSRNMAKAQAQNPGMTAEQLEMGRGMARTFAKFGGFIIMPIAILLTGLITWLAGKIISAKAGLAHGMMIAAFAYVPKIVGTIIGAVQGAMMDPSALTSQFAVHVGPARFFDATTTSLALLTAMGRLEVFTLWSTVIIAIGFKVCGKLDWTKAALGGFLVWAIAGAWPIIGALRAG